MISLQLISSCLCLDSSRNQDESSNHFRLPVWFAVLAYGPVQLCMLKVPFECHFRNLGNPGAALSVCGPCACTP